jgi:hypothetical protein
VRPSLPQVGQLLSPNPWQSKHLHGDGDGDGNGIQLNMTNINLVLTYIINAWPLM